MSVYKITKTFLKLLLECVLVVLIVIAFAFGITYLAKLHDTNSTSKPITISTSSIVPCSIDSLLINWDSIMIIYKETNRVRQENGLGPLRLDVDLTRLAAHKAQVYWELELKQPSSGWVEETPGDYKSTHNTGGRNWLEILKDCDSTHFVEGVEISENISRKSLPAERIVDCIKGSTECNKVSGGWMYSETGHREAILNPNYKSIGIYSGNIGDGKAFPNAFHVQVFSSK